jgi:hypothetical protein
MTVTIQNWIQEEIKRGLNSGNALPKTLKIRIYKTLNLPEVLCGYETWSWTLREEQRLRVFENRVLRRIFGPKRDEWMEGRGESCITRHCMICTLCKV